MPPGEVGATVPSEEVFFAGEPAFVAGKQSRCAWTVVAGGFKELPRIQSNYISENLCTDCYWVCSCHGQPWPSIKTM